MVTKNISFYDIEAFLALIYNNILGDELAEYLETGTYKFPNKEFGWGHSTGINRVSIRVDFTKDHVAFTWPPLQNEGILLETSSNGFQATDRGGNHICLGTDSKTRCMGGSRVPSDDVATLNVHRRRVQSLTLFTGKYYIFVKHRYP